MMRREVVSAIRLERMHGVDSSGVMEAAMGCVDKTAGMGPARIRAMDSEARRGYWLAMDVHMWHPHG
jgi:hypothetical protein